MKGKKTDDEMFIFFLTKAFKNVGLMLFMTAGLSVIVSYAQLILFNNNVSIEEARNTLIGDLKYFLIGIITYGFSYFSFRRELKKTDKNSEHEGVNNNV